ncbi:MAG: sulfotransferase domain-containing protein, partial [Nocardioides sp.]|nr:sulfotransferase domain-containing protein [Nocardioides sp.]
AAIDAEADRLATVDQDAILADPAYRSFHHDHHSYLARGRYLEHVQPWLDLFPRRQLLIMSAERLFTEPAAAFEEVESFLGLAHFDGLDLQPYNQRSRPKMAPETYQRLVDYYRPHNAALNAALGQDFGWEDGYRRWLSDTEDSR